MRSTQKTPEISKNTKLPAIFTKHGAIWAGLLIILSIFINSLNTGSFGIIGQDSDDIIRLVQIKDYLAGQSWFHTDQYRMGLAGGTDMHWSRIPDIPIILLTHVFDVFMSQEKALVWAFTVWPPLSAAIVIFGLLIGAKHWGSDGKSGDKTKVFTLVLLTLYLFSFNRFAPGGIDHHNLQLGFLSVSLGFALDPKLRFRSYFISGCAAALSIAIGVEVYFFAAIICGFVALNWAFRGRSAAAAAQGFGLGFSLMLALSFFGTIAPSEYGLIYCDALSLITVTAGILGGLGLAGLARVGGSSLKDTVARRFLSLIILGIICAGILFFQAPQCLANPLDSLPDEVINLWLDNITEAQPIFYAAVGKTTDLPYMIFAPVIAVIVLSLDIHRDVRRAKKMETGNVTSGMISAKFLPLILLLSALALTFYQVRFYPFAYIFALVPLGGWISRVMKETKLKNPSSVLYLAALLVSAPLAWGIPGTLLENPSKVEEQEETDKEVEKCVSEDALQNLNALPTGTILANPNLAPFILDKTPHRTVSGNYHRNWKGITTQIQISVSDSTQSGPLLLDNNIDYLYYCATGAETDYYARHNEKGLMARLSARDIPDYLEAVSPPNLEGGDVIIFKVKKPEA